MININLQKVNKKINNKIQFYNMKSEEIIIANSEDLNNSISIAADPYGTTQVLATFQVNKVYKKIEVQLVFSELSQKVQNTIINLEGVITCGQYKDFITDTEVEAITFKNKKKDIKNFFHVTIYNKNLVMKNFNDVFLPHVEEPLKMVFRAPVIPPPSTTGPPMTSSSSTPSTGTGTAPTMPVSSTSLGATATSWPPNLMVHPPSMTSTPATTHSTGQQAAIQAAALMNQHTREMNKMTDSLANKDKELEDLKRQLEAVKIQAAEDNRTFATRVDEATRAQLILQNPQAALPQAPGLPTLGGAPRAIVTTSPSSSTSGPPAAPAFSSKSLPPSPPQQPGALTDDVFTTPLTGNNGAFSQRTLNPFEAGEGQERDNDNAHDKDENGEDDEEESGDNTVVRRKESQPFDHHPELQEKLDMIHAAIDENKETPDVVVAALEILIPAVENEIDLETLSNYTSQLADKIKDSTNEQHETKSKLRKIGLAIKKKNDELQEKARKERSKLSVKSKKKKIQPLLSAESIQDI